MADATDPGVILDAYYAKFGEEGDFDRWLLPGEINLQLMAEALQRGEPVTQAVLEEVYERYMGEKYEPPPEGAVT